jgi:hypothetical protein
MQILWLYKQYNLATEAQDNNTSKKAPVENEVTRL